MQDKQLYEYAIIKLVPRVERGEYLNIGVILYSRKKKFLQMKTLVDEARISAFSGEVDVQLIKDYLQAWEEMCLGEPKGGKIGQLEIQVRFRWLTASRSTIIQSSAVHPGFCDDPQLELARLYEKFVS